MKMQLFGKTALVTGASSGIGRALAKALGKQGVVLAISARRKQALDTLADEIEKEGAKRPVVLTADLSKRGEAQLLGERAHEALGRVDILVNNAGVGIGGAQHVIGDDDMARELFETNYWSALALIRALVPAMRERQFGAVVNVASIGAFAPMPLAGHYCSSKAALSLSTEAMRMELRGAGVHVFNVQPGPVDTGMLAEMGAVPGADQFLGRMPRGNVDTLAKKIVRGLERGQRALVYPTSLGIARHLPTVAGRATEYVTRSIDVNDARMLRGGSQGDALAVEARAAFERAAG
ncbi:MAG TPA: SDR family NAD(P)-dependent oxidoreductase [Polyangia bacterium]|nr:SDR family NAD(P)-dependent oxidoreductase [Polyangia bacterium]